jgi:uncharacterized protein DUF1837
MSDVGGISQFVHGGRMQMTFDGRVLTRAVHRTQIVRSSEISTLEDYMADRVPSFYKNPADIAASFAEGYFVSAIKDALRRLPSAENFQASHFGEILAAVYAEEVLGLGRIYSKLTLLTAENANAFKMDVLLYRPNTEPVQFVLAEVKSSMKTANDGLPARHDKTCFASLFDSLNKYKAGDLEFDLATIKERMQELPDGDREAITRSLLPHQPRHVQYAGFCVIDNSTNDDAESAVLGTRTNAKTFEVDLLCVAELPAVVDATYGQLERLR